jgi:hypothetical protein
VSVGIGAIFLVLVVLVALAVASFFRHTLTSLMVLVAIPAGLVLRALMGTSYAVFAIALLAVFATLIYTISDTLRLLRVESATARKRRGRSPSAPSSHRV